MDEILHELIQKFSADSFRDIIEKDLYIPTLVTYTKEDAKINGLRKANSADKVDQEPEFFSALEAIDKSKHIFLVGEKGMGKSAFLKMLFLCMTGEIAGNAQYNLEKITEPMIRSEHGAIPEKQTWSLGAIPTVLLNGETLFNENGVKQQLFEQAENSKMILIDGIDSISQTNWEWLCHEIEAIIKQKPDMVIVLACEADVINRLRPRIHGFTSYTIKSLL